MLFRNTPPLVHQEEFRQKRNDITNIIREKVQNSCQSLFYSTFREELTRQYNSKLESQRRLNSGDKDNSKNSSSNSNNSICEVECGLLSFPFQNRTSCLKSSSSQDNNSCKSVLLIGDVNNIAHVMASQYLKRGLSVSILTTDFQHTIDTLTSIADGSDTFRSKQNKGYLISNGCNNTSLGYTFKLLEENVGKVKVSEKRVYEAIYEREIPLSGQETKISRESSWKKTNCLRVIEGDILCNESIEEAAKSVSLVYLLDIGKNERNHAVNSYDRRSIDGLYTRLRSWVTHRNRLNRYMYMMQEYGFIQLSQTCERIDAHFIALTPLWVQSSYFSPVYWYRRFFSSPSSYCTIINAEEELLGQHCQIKNCEEPFKEKHESCALHSGVCHLKEEERYASEKFLDYQHRQCSKENREQIQQEADMSSCTDEIPYHNSRLCDEYRCTLARVSDLSHFSINEQVQISKKSYSPYAKALPTFGNKSIDVTLFSLFLIRSAALCRSIYDNTFTFSGSTSAGVSMLSASSILRGVDGLH